MCDIGHTPTSATSNHAKITPVLYRYTWSLPTQSPPMHSTSNRFLPRILREHGRKLPRQHFFTLPSSPLSFRKKLHVSCCEVWTMMRVKYEHGRVRWSQAKLACLQQGFVLCHSSSISHLSATRLRLSHLRVVEDEI